MKTGVWSPALAHTLALQHASGTPCCSCERKAQTAGESSCDAGAAAAATRGDWHCWHSCQRQCCSKMERLRIAAEAAQRETFEAKQRAYAAEQVAAPLHAELAASSCAMQAEPDASSAGRAAAPFSAV